MPELSPELRSLLDATTSPERDSAWTRFLDAYSRLILHVARSVSRDHDDVMDAYAHVLQELRADDHARLRAFSPDGRCKFSTWLVVVTRRLCLDQRRRRHGRPRETQSESVRLEQAFRRRLSDLAGENIELITLLTSSEDAGGRVSTAELHEALAAAVGSLAPSDRLLLALRFEDGLSAQEIARVIHVPTPFHVYRRLDAVLRALRELLGARGVDSAAP